MSMTHRTRRLLSICLLTEYQPRYSVLAYRTTASDRRDVGIGITIEIILHRMPNGERHVFTQVHLWRRPWRASLWPCSF